MKVLGCGVEVQKSTPRIWQLRSEQPPLEQGGHLHRWRRGRLPDPDPDPDHALPLCPTLIKQGYVYIARRRCSRSTARKRRGFAYSDKEKADIVKALEGKKYKIDRSKGLGENDPDMMWLTTMNPETRRLIRVMPEDVERTAEVFDLLLGDNLQGRKDHIAENGARFLDLADIS